MPSVSVIVPNYNHARFLRQRVDSILAQTCQDFELILLDDCSTDDSRSVLEEYAADPRVAHLEFNQKNSGSTYKQWNKGVQLAQGKYVWIAESDDYADPRLLDRLVGALEDNEDVSLAYCRSLCVDEKGRSGVYVDVYLRYGKPWTADFCEDGHAALVDYFWRHNPIANASAVVFRKAIYDQVGGADESLRYCADLKLWAAMVLKGNLAYVSEPLNYYRCHTGTVRSKSEADGLHVIEPLEVYRWIFEQGVLASEVREKICEAQADEWVPVLMSLRTQLPTRRAILRAVRALDPHPIRRALPRVRTILRLKVERHWRELLRKLGDAVR